MRVAVVGTFSMDAEAVFEGAGKGDDTASDVSLDIVLNSASISSARYKRCECLLDAVFEL